MGKKSKKKSQKRALTAYNYFLRLTKDDPAFKGLEFNKKSALLSDMWRTAMTDNSDMYKKCVKLSAEDKLAKQNQNQEEESNSDPVRMAGEEEPGQLVEEKEEVNANKAGLGVLTMGKANVAKAKAKAKVVKAKAKAKVQVVKANANGKVKLSPMVTGSESG